MIQQWYSITRFFKFLTESKWSLGIQQKVQLASAFSFMKYILISNRKWACSFFWQWACGLVPTGQLPTLENLHIICCSPVHNFISSFQQNPYGKLPYSEWPQSPEWMETVLEKDGPMSSLYSLFLPVNKMPNLQSCLTLNNR